MSAHRLFADTAYYVALLVPRDDLHAAALATGRSLGKTEIVTTDAVFGRSVRFRRGAWTPSSTRAVKLVDMLSADPDVTIVHQTPGLFFSGVDLYRRRLDKGYSLTDCMSMVVCQEMDIADVLTHDRHFEQEGFVILL